jgi:serine/threonine protein kinase
MSELRQEVKRNRQLIHPNILRVYDFVEDGGIAAVSMDRFDGESLASILARKGKFDPAEVQRVIQQLAATLDDAHRVQLFHRDLSPVNLFVRPNGALFVTNFGVARCIRDAMERTRSVASEALHISYMSPQQVDGEKPSKSDDVYGMGVLAFELLTGNVPFSGADIVPAIRAAQPPKLSDSLGSAVPAEWEIFVSSCLAKKPDQRPAACGVAYALLSAPVAPPLRDTSTPVISIVAPPPKQPVEKNEDAVTITANSANSLAPTQQSQVAPKTGVAERRVSFGGSSALSAESTETVKAQEPKVPAPAKSVSENE